MNLAEVDLLDLDTGEVVSPVHPLDRQANASAQRRARTPAPNDTGAADAQAEAASDADKLAPLMQKLLDEYVATGLPPGFTPSPGAPEHKADRS